MGVDALAQSRTRRHPSQVQGRHEEGVVSKVLFLLKSFLPRHSRARVDFEDGAAGNARADRKSRIDQGIDMDAFEILADQRQSSVGAEVIRQLFDNKVDYLGLTLKVDQNWSLSA